MPHCCSNCGEVVEVFTDADHRLCANCVYPGGWLDPQFIECSQCHCKLGWTLLSPFLYCHTFFCTNCPRKVEIDYYDPKEQVLREEMGLHNEITDQQEEEAKWQKLLRAIEDRLRSCPCGGRFKKDATRRCLHCGSPIKDSSPDRDVSFKDATISSEEYFSRFIIQQDIWR